MPQIAASVIRQEGITTAQRDSLTVTSGEFWKIYNTTTAQWEYWNGSAWVALGEAKILLSDKNSSYGESYINNWRDLVLDDGATYFPNNGGYEKGRLHQLGLIPSLHVIPAAVKEGVLYSVGQNRANDFTVVRAGVGTYRSEDDITETALANVARIDFRDGDGVILVEPQSTNLYLNMEVMITQDVTVAASEYTVSFYGTGTITFTGTHTGSLVGTGLNDLVSITFTPSAGTLTSTISGTVTEGQIELGEVASSRIITVGTTVTRLADMIAGAGSSDTFNSEEGVLYWEVATLSQPPPQLSIAISDGTKTNRVTMFFDSTNRLRVRLTLAGSDQVAFTPILSDITQFNKIAFKYKANDFSLWVNGVEINTDLSGSTFSIGVLNILDLDEGDGTDTFHGKIKSIQVFNRALSDSELETLTTQ